MPNIKSAAKWIKVSAVNRQRNRAAKSLIHTIRAKFLKAIEGDYAEEGLAALGTPLHDFALAAGGAGDADGVLLDVLAGGVVAASRELAVPTLLDHELVATFRAFFRERHIGHGGGFALLDDDALRITTFRITRAR